MRLTGSRRLLVLGVACGLAIGPVGCSEDAPAPAPQGARTRAPGPALTAAEGGAETAEVAYSYDPTDKRDPFRSFVRQLPDDDGIETPLERFDLTQLTVTAIVWGTGEPRALIRDPAGKGYIVTVGTVMGKNKGRIIAIEDNVVKVKETYVDALSRAATKNVEMRLREAQGG